MVLSDQISEEDEKDCLMFHGVKKDAMEEETAGNLVRMVMVIMVVMMVMMMMMSMVMMVMMMVMIVIINRR